MIEMLGVLAIIGVLSVGGIAGYSKAMLKYKTNKTIDQITMLVTNIRTLYAQQKDFDELSVENALTMGVVPDEMYTTGSTELFNPFNGPVTITPSKSLSTDTNDDLRAFIIGVDGLPKEACMAIAVSDWGSNYSSGLIGMAATGSYTAANPGSDTVAATAASGSAAGSLAELYSGSACASSGGALCAKEMPMAVSAASSNCSCTASTCSVAFKYY